jgi:hypothetical protein
MTQDDIRNHLAAHPAVVVQVAAEDDGSPAIAWGDTFCYVRESDGTPRKMPFATIVTKDYPGFDTTSNLDRGGLFRLNIDVGRDKFVDLFGFATTELAQHANRFDYAAAGLFFPHPVYGAHGWVSIINPDDVPAVTALLDFALRRALGRAG